jgi:cyclophilin family peptidyl-prolyl cis-trans isomerase
MPSRRSSQAVPGLIFALLVCLGIAWTVISSVTRKNAEAAQAAEAARLAQVQAAEQARQTEAARIADLPRVKRGIAGEWAGAFGRQANARLTISREHKAISGVLRSGEFREVFRGEILPDNRLMLTPLSVKKTDGSDAPRYSLDTLWLELSGDGISLRGSYRDARNSGGAVSLMRTSALPESNAVTPPTSTSTAAQEGSSTSNKIAELHTTAGEIDIRFSPEVAPNHVRNFIELAEKGFYNGTKFHRVIPGFMIQGGDPNTISGSPNTWGTGGSGKNIAAEFSSVKHKRGIVSMARSNTPDSASSQFFIMVADSPSLDGQYSVFGQVTKGMDVADKIVNAPTGEQNRPNFPTSIERIVIRDARADD